MTMCTNSAEDIQNNKEAKNSKGSREIFSRLSCFYRLYRAAIPRPVNRERRKIFYSGKKKRHTVKNQLMVNNRGYILHKLGYKNGRKHDYDVYKKNYPVTPKEVVTVVDLGYLGVENDFPEQLSILPYKKKRDQFLSDDEKDTTKVILEKE